MACSTDGEEGAGKGLILDFPLSAERPPAQYN